MYHCYNHVIFMLYFIFIPIALAIAYAVYLMFWLKKQPSGSKEMVAISQAIQTGSSAYLNRQYRSVGIAAVPLFLLIGFFIDWVSAVGFVVGAVLSAATGYIGMNVAVRSNSKTAAAAEKGLGQALSLGFKAGSVTGLLVVALGLLSVAGFYLVTHDVRALVGLGFGASLISVFARLGGGIFTKAADVGADLVGKVEANIPEDDPRNPAVIADNVGDNVGDCAGMAADLFETYAVTLIAAILLGYLIIGNAGVYFPLAMGGSAIIASIFGGFFVKTAKKESLNYESANIMKTLYKGLFASLIISAALFYPITKFYFAENYWRFYLSAIIGLIITIL